MGPGRRGHPGAAYQARAPSQPSGTRRFRPVDGRDITVASGRIYQALSFCVILRGAMIVNVPPGILPHRDPAPAHAAMPNGVLAPERRPKTAPVSTPPAAPSHFPV